jgi:DNA helicase-2/ATP-dependent DNA helicase PcrA
MERLVLTCAEERRRFGSRSWCVASRFLSEIPRELLDGAPAAAAQPSRAEPGGVDYSYGQWDGGDAPAVAAGARVRHPIFGPGTVVGASGSGPGQKLRIRFDRVGVKTVLVRFANLEFE